MNVRFKSSFKKDLKRIQDQKLLLQVSQVIAEVKAANALQDVTNVSKLKGYDHFYRIRLGSFRLGIKVTEQDVIFIRFLHRREIYRFFP